jgi:hypothetical protein
MLPRARRALASAAQRYDRALQRAPLLTKSVSSGLVSGAQRARADGAGSRTAEVLLLCAAELD